MPMLPVVNLINSRVVNISNFMVNWIVVIYDCRVCDGIDHRCFCLT